MIKSRTMQLTGAVFGALIVLFCAPAPAQSDSKKTAQPVLVELFTSEGCANCPPAERFLSELAGKEGIVAVAWHVDYWDDDWSDPFANHAFSNRQLSYARKFSSERVYTPQMIVDGRVGFNGCDRRRAHDAIEEARAQQKTRIFLEPHPAEDAPEVFVAAVRVEQLPRSNSDYAARIILAVTEDNLTISITGGENSGRTLKHDAVVRWASVVGETNGEPFEDTVRVTLGRDWKPDELRLVAFVQERSSKHVLGTTSAPLIEIFRGQHTAP